MIRIIPLTLFTAASSLTWAFQGQSGQNPRPEPGQGTGQHTKDVHSDAKRSDGLLASWLVVGSNNEVALAELAQQRSTNPDVKAFAQKMVDEHRRLSEKLQPFAGDSMGKAGQERGNEPGRPREGGFEDSGDVADAHEGGFESRDEVARQHDTASKGSGDFDHLGLIRELGEQCKQSARKELESKQAAEFDRCYVAMAIGAHMQANDMMTVFQRHASGALKPALSEGQKVVTAHLQHAKDLARRLEDKRAPTSVGSR